MANGEKKETNYALKQNKKKKKKREKLMKHH